LQLHNFTDCARELSKLSKDTPHQVFESAMKKKFDLGFRVSMSDVISGVGFWPFWLRLPSPRPNN